MAEITVERLMSTDLVTIETGAAAAEAASRMLETGVNSILVVDNDRRLAGLITGRDFVSLVRQNEPQDTSVVDAFMTTDVLTVSLDDSVAELAEPTEQGYTHLPVVDGDGTLVGMVSTTDFTAYVSGKR